MSCSVPKPAPDGPLAGIGSQKTMEKTMEKIAGAGANQMSRFIF
jgi:hypothetical protein